MDIIRQIEAYRPYNEQEARDRAAMLRARVYRKLNERLRALPR